MSSFQSFRSTQKYSSDSHITHSVKMQDAVAETTYSIMLVANRTRKAFLWSELELFLCLNLYIP